jgi:hypothetical protein
MGNDESTENVKNILKRGASSEFSLPESPSKLLCHIEKNENISHLNKNNQEEESENSSKSSFLDSLNSEFGLYSNKNKYCLTSSKTQINEKLINNIPYNLIGCLFIKYEKDVSEYKYNCFIINTNCFMTLKNNIYHPKLGNAREIKVNFSILMIKKENIIIKGKYAILGFEEDFSKNYFGLESLNEEEKGMKEFYISSIIDINSKNNIPEIHSLISNTNTPINIQDCDKEKISRIIGSPLYYYDNENQIYVIGLIDESFNYSFFDNCYIEEFSNAIKTFQLSKINQNKQNLENKSIERLDLSGINILKENIKFLLKDDFINLKYLDVSNIIIEEFKSIFDLKYKNLQYLNLNYNNIQNNGLSLLAKSNFPQLKNLHLKNNGLTNEGIKYFIDNSVYAKNLTVLNLSDNKLTDENVYDIVTNMKELTRLDLKCTGISDISLDYIIKYSSKIQIIDISYNYLSRDYCENKILKLHLKQCTINYINIDKIKNIKKNLELDDNKINSQLIKSINFFDNNITCVKMRPYHFRNYNDFNNEEYLILYDDTKNMNEEKEINLENNSKTKNIPNNIFDQNAKLSLKNKYLYNCITNIKVTFPNDKNPNIYNCFVLGPNLLVTLTENIFNIEKGGEAIKLEVFNKTENENKIIYESDNISYIIFQNPIFEEWLGCKILDNNINNNNIFIISFFQNNLNIAKLSNNVLIPNNDNDKLNLEFIPGSPIILFENEDINNGYVIGLYDKNLGIRYFNNEDLEQFSYNSKLIKLMRNKFNCYDIEDNLINLSLNNLQIRDNDLKNFCSLNLFNLESLDFKNNNITPIGCFYLSKMNFPSLKKLILSNNDIRDGGLKNISFINSPKLQHLEINDNKITQNSINYLKNINFMQELLYLNLSNNQIKDEGIKIFCQIELYNLIYLNIENIGMNDLGLSEFTKDNTFFDKLETFIIINNNYEKNSNITSILNSKIKNFRY